MRRREIALIGILAAVALGIITIVPTRRDEVIAGAALIAFLGSFIVLSESVGKGAVRSSVVDAVLAEPEPRPARPSDLEKLERSLGWRAYDGAEFDVRVRPLLADLIEHRGGSSEVVGSILAHGRRVGTEDIERMVERIERLR